MDCPIQLTGRVTGNPDKPKGLDMNKSVTKTADSRETGEAGKRKQVVEPSDEFIKHIEAQASAQSQVMREVLERQERASWRHWGIND